MLASVVKLGGAISMSCLGTSFAPLVLASTPSAQPQKTSVPASLTFNSSAKPEPKPGPWGRPTHRTPGGTREGCLGQLVALVPGEHALLSTVESCWQASISHVALTTQKQPVLWFYVPQLPPNQRQAEFTLFDQHEQELDYQVVALPKTAGVMGVQIQYPLSVNQQYGWSFSLLVDPQRPSKNPTVDGFIERLPSSSLTQASPVAFPSPARVAWFARQGIWHDAITVLIHHRCLSPNAPFQDEHWASLLDSVGLSVLAKTTIADCEILAKTATTHNQLPTKTKGAQ